MRHCTTLLPWHGDDRVACAGIQVQKADAEDPWLQQAWAQVLQVQGRSQEAAVHMHVAGSLLLAHLKQTGSKGPKASIACKPLKHSASLVTWNL